MGFLRTYFEGYSSRYSFRVVGTTLSIFADFVNGGGLMDELMSAAMTLDGRTVSMNGINLPLAAAQVQRQLLSRLGVKLTQCLVSAVFVEGPSPFLRRTTFMSTMYPSLTFHIFQRLFTTRFFQWLGRKATPAIVRRVISICMGNPPGSAGDAATSGVFDPPSMPLSPECLGDVGVEMPSTLGTNPEEPYLTILSPSSVADFFQAYIDTHGVCKYVLETNFLDYTSAAFIEQLQWVVSYYNAKEGQSRAIFKTHMASSTVAFFEFIFGMGIRCLSANIGNWAYPKKGMGAFWGENIGHLVLCYWAAPVIVRLGAVTYAYLETRWFPTDDVEREMDAEEEEEFQRQQQEHAEFRQEAMNATDPEGEDYYKVLGVENNASTEQIKKAYHKIALKMHPDKLHGLPEPEREEKQAEFKRVTHAKSILSNPDKRRHYDMTRTMGKPPAFMAKLQRLPMSAKIGISIVITVGASYAAVFALYAHSFVALRILAARGRSVMRMWLGE